LDQASSMWLKKGIGVVTFAGAHERAEDVLALADMLMYDAKDAGRDRFTVLDDSTSVQPRSGARMEWKARIEAALENGYDAVWWARFPIGPEWDLIARSAEYEEAWDAHFHEKPCVSLCLFIVGDLERERVVPLLAETHDSVLSA